MINEELIKSVKQLPASPSLRAEFDLLAAKAFLAIPDAVYLFNNGRFLIQSNPPGSRLQGCESDELIARNCCEMFWHVEGADGCVVDRALQIGERVEVEIQAGADGNKAISIIVEPLSAGDDVKPAALVIARDISELRRAEAEALAHKSFLASIADRTPDEIYALDAQSRITWMNERAEADKVSTSLGGAFLDIVSADSRTLSAENVQRTLAGDDTEYEVRVIRADGSTGYAEAHTSPLWKDGEIVGVLVFFRDVTDRNRERELMAQSDKLRAVGELAAGVAHNLNNSLTVIQGRAQLLLMRSGADEANKKSLEVITQAVGDCSQTLRRLLDFSRRGSTRASAPVDLSELIASSVEIARPKWQA